MFGGFARDNIATLSRGVSPVGVNVAHTNPIPFQTLKLCGCLLSGPVIRAPNNSGPLEGRERFLIIPYGRWGQWVATSKANHCFNQLLHQITGMTRLTRTVYSCFHFGFHSVINVYLEPKRIFELNSLMMFSIRDENTHMEIPVPQQN